MYICNLVSCYGSVFAWGILQGIVSSVFQFSILTNVYFFSRLLITMSEMALIWEIQTYGCSKGRLERWSIFLWGLQSDTIPMFFGQTLPSLLMQLFGLNHRCRCFWGSLIISGGRQRPTIGPAMRCLRCIVQVQVEGKCNFFCKCSRRARGLETICNILITIVASIVMEMIIDCEKHLIVKLQLGRFEDNKDTSGPFFPNRLRLFMSAILILILRV